MKISQSLIKDVIPTEACALFVRYRYIDGVVPEDDEEQGVMFRGLYFEWHLLGATRGGEEPVFEKLKRGSKNEDGQMDYRPQEERKLSKLVEEARITLHKMGLDTRKGDKQVHLQTDTDEGHIDWITIDPYNPSRKAIIDIKYTETKYDDRWNGWGDFDSKWDAKLQAVHYIKLYREIYGEYVPFYFIIFGKAGWCRVIKVEVSDFGISQYLVTYNKAISKLKDWIDKDWPANPEAYKCSKCGFRSFCEARTVIPEVEVFEI